MSKRTASEACQAWRAVKVAHFQFSTLVHTRWVFLVWSVSLWETPPLTRQSEPWREGSAGSAVKNVFKEARWLCYCGKCQGSLLTTLWRSHIKTEMFWESHTSSSVNWKGNSNIKLKLKLWDPCFLEYTWLSTEWALKIIPLEVESERKETLEATLECVSLSHLGLGSPLLPCLAGDHILLTFLFHVSQSCLFSLPPLQPRAKFFNIPISMTSMLT